MTIIKFNGTTEFEVESYNKNTYLGVETITSNANCGLRTSDSNAIATLAVDPITSIQIYYDGTQIYNLQNVNGRIDTINEYLNGDRISININIIFQTLDNE